MHIDAVNDLFSAVMDQARKDLVYSWQRDKTDYGVEKFINSKLFEKWCAMVGLDVGKIDLYRKGFWQSCAQRYWHDYRFTND